MFDRWNFTVCSVTQSIRASSLFECPSATSWRISSSRFVRPGAVASDVAAGAPWSRPKAPAHRWLPFLVGLDLFLLCSLPQVVMMAVLGVANALVVGYTVLGQWQRVLLAELDGRVAWIGRLVGALALTQQRDLGVREDVELEMVRSVGEVLEPCEGLAQWQG